MATVYEAKSGVEFGGSENEQKYRAAEDLAKRRKQGLWKNFGKGNGVDFESPREYKTRMGKLGKTTESEALAVDESKKSGIVSSLLSRLWPFGSKKQ